LLKGVGVRVLFSKLSRILLSLLPRGIFIVAHVNIVLRCARVVRGLHVHVLVGRVWVLNEAVSRGVLDDEREWEATAINVLLDLLDELINLSSSSWVMLAPFLLQIL